MADVSAKYYGWLGQGGYDGLVKIENGHEAYVFRAAEGKFVRNDDYMKAKYDPGSDFEEITKEEADAIVAKLGAKNG